MAFEDLLDQVTEAPNPAREGQLAFRQAGGTSGTPPVRARLRQLPIEELDVPDRIRSTLLKRREQELETTRVREEGGFAQFRQQLQEGVAQDRLARAQQNLASFANKNKDNPDAREALDIMRSIQGLHEETLHQRGPVEAGNVVAEAILEFTPSIPLFTKAILVDGLVTVGLTFAGTLAGGAVGGATGFAVGASRVARGIGLAAKIAQGGKLKKGAKLSQRILKNAPRKAISGAVTTAVFFPEFFSKISNRVLDAGGSLENAVAHGYWGGFAAAAVESLISPARLIGLQQGSLLTRPLSDKIGEWLVDKPIRKVAARLTMNRVISFIGEDMEEGAQGGVSDMAAFLAAKAEKDPEVFNSLMEEINEELKRHEGEEGFEEVKNAWDLFTRVALKDAQQAMKAVAGGAILGIPGGIRTEGRNAFKVRNRRQDLRDRGVDPDLILPGGDEGEFLEQADATIERIDERQVRERTLRQERKNKAAARQAEQAKTDDQREILGDGGSRASEIIAAFHLGRDIEGDAIVETIRADTERQAQAVDDVTQKQAIREAGRERIDKVRTARQAVKASRKNQVQEDYAEVRNTMVEIAKENIKATTPDISDEVLQSEAERQVDTREQEILLEEGIAEQQAGLTSEDAEEQVDNLPEEQQEETNILRSIVNAYTEEFTAADLDADIDKRSRRDVQTDLALSELPESAQQFLKELPSGRGFKKRGEAPGELTRTHFHKVIEMLKERAGITWDFETEQWVPFQPDTGEVARLTEEITALSNIIAKTGTTKARKKKLTTRRADLEQQLAAARDREAQTPTPVPEAPETPEGEQGEPQLIPEERRLPAARAPEQERKALAARLLGVLGQIPAIGDEVFPGITLLSKSTDGFTFDITESPNVKDISRIALNERNADFIPARVNVDNVTKKGDETLLIRRATLKEAMIEMQVIINDVHEESRESPVGRPLTIDDLRGITMMSDDPVVFDVTDASFEVRRAITDSDITIFERDGRNLAGFTDDVSAGEAINTLLAIQTSVERPPDPVVSGERGRQRQKNREAAEKADRLDRQRLRKSHSQHDSDVIKNIKTLFGRAAVKKRWEDSGTDLKQDQWILANEAIFNEERYDILKKFQERMKEAKIWDFQILNIRRQIAGKAPEDTVGVRIEGNDQSRTAAAWQTVIEGLQAQINEVFADKKTRDLFLAVGGDKKKGTITDDEIARRLNDIDSQSTYEAEFGDNVELHKVDRAARLVDALLEAERPPVTLAEMGEVISLINEGFESVEELNLTQRQQALLQEGQTATATIKVSGLVTRSDRPPGTPGPATVEGDQIRINVEVYDPVQELVSDLMYQLENTLSRLHRIAREDIQGFETVFVDGQPRVESRNQAGREAKFRRLFNLFLEYYQLTASQISFKDAVTGVTAAQERQKARQNESAADMGIDKELTNYGFNNVRLSPENKVIVNRLDAEINAHDKEIGILRSAREDRANTADQLDRIDNLIRIQVVERDDKLRQMTTILNQGERTKEQIRKNIHELIGFEDEEYRRTGGKSGVKIEPDSDIAEELGRRFVKDVTEVAESRAVFATIKRLKADPKFLSVGQIESKIHDAVKFEGVRGNDIRRAYARAMMAEFNRVENLNKDARREASEKGEILPEYDYERTNLESMVAAISDVDLDARIAELEEEQKAIERRPSSAGGQVVAQLQTEIDRLNGERVAPEGFKPKTRQLNAIARAGLQLTSTPTSLVQQSILSVKKTLKSKEDRQGNTLDKQIWRLLGGNTDPFLVHSTKLVNEMATNEGIKFDSQDDTRKKLEGSARRQIREAEEREAAVPFGEEGTPITRFEGTGEELDLGREDFSDKFVKALTEEELDEIRGRLENEYVPAEVNYVKSLMAMDRLAVFLETGQQPDPARDKRRLDDATARARREFRKDLGQIDTRIDQRRLGERERRFTQEEINTVNEFFQLQRAELREGTQQNLDALVEKVSGKRFKEEGGRVIARATSAAENAETLLGRVGTTAVEDIAIHTAVRRASRRFGISEHEVRSIASGTMLTGTDRLPARSRAATEAEGEAREEQSDDYRLLAERTLDSRSGLVERATLLASSLINRVGELVGRAGTQPGQAGTRAVPAQDTRLADARLEESKRLEEFRRNFPDVDPQATGLFPLTFGPIDRPIATDVAVRGPLEKAAELGEMGASAAAEALGKYLPRLPGTTPIFASRGHHYAQIETYGRSVIEPPAAPPRTGVPTAEELAAERTVRGAIRQAIDEFRDVMADLISDETIIQNLRKMYGIHTEGRPGLEVPIPAQRAEFDDTGVQTAAELPPAFRLRRSGPQRIDDRIAGTILDELQRNLAGVARNIQIGQTERTAEETAFLPRLTAEVNDLISRYKTLTETGSVIGEANVVRLQRLRGELAVAEESGTPQDVARLKWDIELEERGVVGRFQLDPKGRPIGLDEINRNLSKAFGRRVNLKEGETTNFRDGLYNIKIETGRGRPSQVKIGDGFAHIFIDLDSATATTVRHETLGHLGLAGMNNANLNAVIDYLGITNESIAEEAASNRSLFPDLTEEQANRLAREEMVNQRLDEIDSGLAQATPRMQAIIAQFKEFLARIARAFGIDYRPTGPLADIARIRSGRAQAELLEGRVQPGFEATSGTRRQDINADTDAVAAQDQGAAEDVELSLEAENIGRQRLSSQMTAKEGDFVTDAMGLDVYSGWTNYSGWIDSGAGSASIEVAVQGRVLRIADVAGALPASPKALARAIKNKFPEVDFIIGYRVSGRARFDREGRPIIGRGTIISISRLLGQGRVEVAGQRFEGGASRQFRGEEFTPPESDANSEPATEEEMTFTQAEKVLGAKARLNHIKSGSPLPFTTWVKTAAAEKLKNQKTKSKEKSKGAIEGQDDAVQRDLDLINREGMALSEEGSAATPSGYKGFLGNFKRGLSMFTLGQFTPTDSAKVAGAAYANQVAIDRTKMTATFLHMYHGIADMVRHGDKDRGIEKRHIRGAGWKKRQNVNWRGADTQVGDEVRAAQDFTANRGQLLGVLIQLLASAQTTGKRVDTLLTKGGFMLLDGKGSKRFVVDNSDHRDALIEQISAMDPNLRLEAERLNKIMNELSDLVQPVFKKMFPNAKWNRRDFYLHIMRNYHEETIKDKQLRQNDEYKRMTPSQKERLGRMALLFEIDPNNVKNLRTLTGSGDSPILIADANDTINHTIQDLSKFVAAGEYVRQKRALYATTEFKNKIRAALSGDADKMNLVVDAFEREIESLGGTRQTMDPTASVVGRFINRLLSNAAVSFIADPFVAVKQFGSYGNLATHFGASVWREASLSRMDAREFKKVLNKTTVIKMRGKDVGGGYSSIWEDQRSGSGFRLTGFRGATDVIDQAREGGMFLTRKMDRFTTQRAIHMAQILVDKTWDGPKDDSYYQEIANQADLGVVTTQIQTTDFNRSLLQRNRNPFARTFTFLRGARSVSGSALLSSATLVFQSFSRLSDAQKSGDAQRIRQATAERSEALLNMKAQYIFHGMVQSVIIQTVQSGKWFLIPAVLGALGFGADDDDEEEDTGMKKTMDFFVGAGGNIASLPMGGDLVFQAMKAFGDSKRGIEYSKQRVATTIAPIIGFPYDIMDFGAASAKVRKFEREIEQRQTEDGRSLTSSELRQRERWLRLNYVKQAEKGFRVISQWMLGVPFSNTISQVASKGARNLIEENYK